MQRIREQHSASRTPGGTLRRALRGTLLTLAMSLLVIAGLMGMHTLSVGHALPGAGQAVAAHGTSAGHGAAAGHGTDLTQGAVEAHAHHGLADPAVSATHAVAPHAAVSADACADDACGGSMPDHTMQMMLCVLALLAAALVLLAPRLLGRLRLPLFGIVSLRVLRGALPHPRPPSLLFLSISRT